MQNATPMSPLNLPKPQWLDRLSDVLLALLAATLAFPHKINVVFFLLLLALVLYRNGFTFFAKMIKGDRIVQLLLAYYVLYLITALRDETVSAFFSTLDRRAPIFFLPVVVAATVTASRQKNFCLKWFVLSVVAASLASFVILFTSFKFNSFNLQYFAWQLNEHALIPSNHLALFVTMAIVIMLDRFGKEGFFGKGLSIVILIFLFAFQLLLGSRMPFISTILLICGWLLFTGLWGKRSLRLWASLLVIGVAVAAVIFVPYLRHKFSALASSREPRYYEFTAAVKVFKSKPLTGYGLRGADDALYDEYDKMGFYEGRKNEFNAHNEFLQTSITTGIIGLTVLLFLLIVIVKRAMATREFLPIAFIALFLLGSLTEVLLMRSKGIVFFSFFTGLFFISRESQGKDT
jgi:O-antigen ligase